MSMKKENFCAIQLKTTTEKFVFQIDNFSEHEQEAGESLDSTEFISTAPNGQILKWELKIYPNGEKEDCKDYVSLFLYIIEPEEVKAKFEYSIRKSNGDEFELKPFDEKWLKFGGSSFKGWGLRDMIKREDMLNEENGYLDGDRLTIVCTVMVQQKLVEKAPLPDVEVPESQVVEDLSKMFEESLFTDCIIKSEDGKEFKVHKCILGSRSPVFGAMFEHEMLEKNNNEVNITDMKGDVIEKMLRFIYSGKEPDFEELAEELLEAADKYELIRLKLLCERELINSLENANACSLLSLANLHSAEHLKTHSINFIKMNLKEVKKSEGWKTFANDELKDQIFEAM